MSNTIKANKNPAGETEKSYLLEISDKNSERIDRIVEDYYDRILSNLDKQYIHTTKKTDRMADTIASFGGSWRFILIFAAVLCVWILWNTLPFVGIQFDPKPFILLNLCLSFVAAFQAPIIMMSQNRQAARDKHESVIDFAINYKAEQEIDDIQTQLSTIENELQDMKRLLRELCDAKSD